MNINKTEIHFLFLIVLFQRYGIILGSGRHEVCTQLMNKITEYKFLFHCEKEDGNVNLVSISSKGLEAANIFSKLFCKHLGCGKIQNDID